MAIQAVIWDIGGVLTTSPFEAFNRYEVRCGLPENFIRTVNATNPDSNAWALLERGEIDTFAFDRRFLEESTALGHPLRGAEVLPLLSGEIRRGMVEALLLCKQHFKVGAITNNIVQSPGPELRAASAGGATEITRYFDAIIESSKTGMRKPDPRIYRMMCELLGVDAAACVYLDDLGINCKPAAQLGMTAIKVVSEAQALADLQAATGLRFPRIP